MSFSLVNDDVGHYWLGSVKYLRVSFEETRHIHLVTSGCCHKRGDLDHYGEPPFCPPGSGLSL